GCPSSKTVPASGISTPANIFMSVDLPAPFSPTTARTSPGRRRRSTSCSACTPGKALEMPRASSRGRSASFELSQLGMERLDVLLGDLAVGDVDAVVGLDVLVLQHRLVPARQRCHDLDGAIAELVGVLHDRAVDGAVLDPLERLLVLVEAYQRHLADLLGGLDALEHGRRVVSPQPDHALEVLDLA